MKNAGHPWLPFPGVRPEFIAERFCQSCGISIPPQKKSGRRFCDSCSHEVSGTIRSGRLKHAVFEHLGRYKRAIERGLPADAIANSAMLSAYALVDEFRSTLEVFDEVLARASDLVPRQRAAIAALRHELEHSPLSKRMREISEAAVADWRAAGLLRGKADAGAVERLTARITAPAKRDESPDETDDAELALAGAAVGSLCPNLHSRDTFCPEGKNRPNEPRSLRCASTTSARPFEAARAPLHA